MCWRFAILNTCKLNLPWALNIFHSIYLSPKHIETIRIGYRTLRINIYMATRKWKLSVPLKAAMRFDLVPKGHKVTKRQKSNCYVGIAWHFASHFMAKIVLPLLNLIDRYALPWWIKNRWILTFWSEFKFSFKVNLILNWKFLWSKSFKIS